ncbi:MAG TPA: endo-1,4-beta-xylanase [Candidatus Didemnitutus sp.]
MNSLPFVSILAALGLGAATVMHADWRADADARIERLRKSDFEVQARDPSGATLAVKGLTYRLVRHRFLFGTAIAYRPFADQGPDGRHYRDFILANFSGLVCENEMKWYDDEAEAGHENYAEADALLQFAEQHGLVMRGHNLFWAKEKYAMNWLKPLDATQLRAAVERRLDDTVTRYRGRVICWDVNNEMLDGTFFRDRLGADIVPWMYKETARLDPNARLFVNEYGILGNPEKTGRLIGLVHDLQAHGAPVGGIGIQSHDSDRLTEDPTAKVLPGDRPEWMLKNPLTPEMFLGTLDRIYRETKLPIHLTEISAKVPSAEDRADKLEMLFRLGFSHEAVQAILLWGFEARTHWMGPQAALMEADGSLNAAGKRISHLLQEEWTSKGEARMAADGEGHFRGFRGLYELRLELADGRTVTRQVALDGAAPTVVVVP